MKLLFADRIKKRFFIQSINSVIKISLLVVYFRLRVATDWSVMSSEKKICVPIAVRGTIFKLGGQVCLHLEFVAKS